MRLIERGYHVNCRGATNAHDVAEVQLVVILQQPDGSPFDGMLPWRREVRLTGIGVR